MITVTSAPPSYDGVGDKPQPIPVSDCLQWCLQAASEDVVISPGAYASIIVTFPSTISSIPANGTAFTLWGEVFMIDNTVPGYTSNTFEVVSSGGITGGNFRNMLNANLNISRYATAVVNPDFFTSRSTLLKWKECKEQPRFDGDNMDLANLETISTGETPEVLNGQTPIYVDRFKIVTRLMRFDNAQGYVPVTEYEGFLPQLTCDSAEEICLDMMRAAKRLLVSPMPDLSDDSEIDPEVLTMTGLFALQYGWTYTDENCQPQSGTFMQTDPVFVLNAAFDIEQAYGTAPFWYKHPDFGGLGFTRQRFLTNQPVGNRLVSRDSYAWLWWLNGYTDDFPGLDHFQIVLSAEGKDGSSGVSGIAYDKGQWYYAFNTNISPARVADLTGVDILLLKEYTVELQLRDAADEPISVDGFTNAMDSGRYVISDCNGSETDVYFVTSPGGIATMLCQVDAREISQSGNEICLDIQCGDSAEEIAKYSGRGLSNIRNFERVTISAIEIYTDDQVNFFRSFKLSPERWIRVQKKTYSPFDVQWMAKRFLVEPGGVRIFQDGNRIELVATGFMADIPVQTPNFIR